MAQKNLTSCSLDSKRYPIIFRNAGYSETTMAGMSARLAEFMEEEGITCNNVSVVAFGSFARSEAYKSSDVDFGVIVGEGTCCDECSVIAERIREITLEVIDSFNLERPNAKGVFDTVVLYHDLIRHVGSREDTYDILACRLLLLLEAQPIWGKELFETMRENLIQFYEADVARDSSKNHVFLLNDLARYFRTICVNYAYSKQRNGEKWAIRNVKLRHSRVVMYISMVLALGTLSKSGEKGLELRSWIEKNPLERFRTAYEIAEDPGFYKVAGLYNTYMNLMSDPEIRESLLNLDYDHRYNSSYFSMLKSNSDALASEISRFIFSRRGSWSDRFLEYLLI